MEGRKNYPILGIKYRHYKGGRYIPITLATNTETNETDVVYKSVEFGSVYTRPLKQWFEDVTIPAITLFEGDKNTTIVKRFRESNV